ncbi:preprotein translocase SecA [Actinoplanes sp. NBRC 14428]|uniref:SEC-C motif-containing protein n=1 Tax=Pseudosporangium ferrugineum TaxID=439699 RepID=A0A2T0RJF7_9ACTN|nr:SEC-C metal-binding domain-containing protein [Pseudosporangium ferrugineum]PRY21313.1 SEC-C motif-containing protein [Pseudosporangium ferrugineum]BCJ55947.1 preprotein translocase SecA [Actinoplanes sp. NBRC 14428]
MANADTKLAAELETDADRYPDERPEILLEAADAWQRAGRSDRARAILDELVEGGGEYGCDARIQLADLHLQAGDTMMAYAELNTAAKDHALGERQCELAAELLAAHGDLDQAARWYDRAAARLTDEQLDALRRGDKWPTIGTTIMLRNRQQVRQRLGRSPDLLDTLVPELTDPEKPTTAEDVLDLMDSGFIPRQTRMLTFRRDQRRLAQQQWPGVYDQPDDEYYAAAEHRWREVRDGGVPSITVVAADVDDLIAFARLHGGSPTDPAIKRRYCETAPDRVTIDWPPERNAACWCGSGRKYKKCCGRPWMNGKSPSSPR